MRTHPGPILASSIVRIKQFVGSDNSQNSQKNNVLLVSNVSTEQSVRLKLVDSSIVEINRVRSTSSVVCLDHRGRLICSVNLADYVTLKLFGV